MKLSTYEVLEEALELAKQHLEDAKEIEKRFSAMEQRSKNDFEKKLEIFNNEKNKATQMELDVLNLVVEMARVNWTGLNKEYMYATRRVQTYKNSVVEIEKIIQNFLKESTKKEPLN